MLFCEDQNINPLFIKRTSNIFHELQVNGQPANTDDDDAPVDYTAGDDEGAEDTGAPANDTPEDNPTDAPEDYTVPDEGEESAGTDVTAGDAQPADANMGGGEEAPTDYTAEDTGGDDMGGGDEGTNPTDMEGTVNTSGEGGDPPTDYTDDAGGGDTGSGEDMGGGEPAGDTTGGDDEIDQLEDDILGDLSDEQMAIKDKELKTNFSNLYDVIIDIEERINNVSKDANMIKPMEFISNKLSDLSTQVSDYLSYTYETKSYTENMVMYRTFLAILEQINTLLDNIKSNGAK